MTTTTSQQLGVLMEMAALVSSTLDPREVRVRAIEAVAKLLVAEAGSLILIDHQSGDLYFEVAVGNKGEILRQVRMKKGEGIAGWVAEHGIPQMVHDVVNDPRFLPDIDRMTGFATRTMICVPVKIKGKTVGVLEAINHIDGRFTEEDQELLVALANHVAIALENARLHEDNMRQLSQLVAEEKRHRREKEKLIKDLHDGIGGIMTNINLLSELAQKSADLEGMKKALGTIAEISREGSAEIRSFMNGLENPEATWQDLAAEFRRNGNTIIEPHDIDFAMNTDISFAHQKVGIFLYMSLFRIFREALTNVVKHSKARKVEVLLAVTGEGVTFTVSDDGKGFPSDNRLGRGLANMKTRASEIGGSFSLLSGRGTAVHVHVPLPMLFPEQPHTPPYEEVYQ